MLQRVKIDGMQLPFRLYLAENEQDVQLAMANGLPFVKWKQGMDKFIKFLLRPALEKLFPGINWNKVLGKKRHVESLVYNVEGYVDNEEHEVASYDAEAMLENQLQVNEDDLVVLDLEETTRGVDIATSERDCCNDFSYLGDTYNTEAVSVYDYIGDISSYVNIEVLQELKMLPKFIGDIADCIKKNLSNNMYWTEGYNKKLGQALGNFKGRGTLPNLVIIDCSHSIPDGIAATMLTLADTLREECNAELIITSRRSGWYPIGAELPSPQVLRSYYGRSNESSEFMAILEQHIAGREFGHVISFGDYDCPGSIDQHHVDMAGTTIHEVHHYHTSEQRPTGYARWCKECCPDVDQTYDTSWCKVIKKNIC